MFFSRVGGCRVQHFQGVQDSTFSRSIAIPSRAGGMGEGSMSTMTAGATGLLMLPMSPPPEPLMLSLGFGG